MLRETGSCAVSFFIGQVLLIKASYAVFKTELSSLEKVLGIGVINNFHLPFLLIHYF